VSTAIRGRVLLLVKSDGVGGVERLASSLVTLLSDEDGLPCEVAVMSRSDPGILAAERPAVLETSVGRGPLRRIIQLRQLRAKLRGGEYEAVVSFGPSPNALNALATLGRRRSRPAAIIAEVGDPFIRRRRRWNATWMWTYRLADVLVVQTERLASEVRPIRRRPRRVEVIPNVVSPAVPFVPPTSRRERLIVGVGRLVPSKRYADLIEAFARLGPRADGWRLVILGDGDEHAALRDTAERLAVTQVVEIPGRVDAPWEVLSTAAVFVLCSQNEGFPTVLLEAMASGCAIVSADCRFGPRDVLEEGSSGVLYPVGDVDRLVAALADVIGDERRRVALAEGAHRRVVDFTGPRIGRLWLDLIESTEPPCPQPGPAPPNR
jgi:GalNAc-alpha-(1->4)-GalNAc-alpha-(1->3)-diNAcBac-PP-undecaprenol alpha-1,4-N-acetyl-D-galactosaminyltransferase